MRKPARFARLAFTTDYLSWPPLLVTSMLLSTPNALAQFCKSLIFRLSIFKVLFVLWRISSLRPPSRFWYRKRQSVVSMVSGNQTPEVEVQTTGNQVMLGLTYGQWTTFCAYLNLIRSSSHCHDLSHALQMLDKWFKCFMACGNVKLKLKMRSPTRFKYDLYVLFMNYKASRLWRCSQTGLKWVGSVQPWLCNNRYHVRGSVENSQMLHALSFIESHSLVSLVVLNWLSTSASSQIWGGPWWHRYVHLRLWKYQ